MESRRRLLVLHGAGSRAERHAGFVEAARARGFDAQAPDLPGHGSGRLDAGAVEWVRRLCAPGIALRAGSLGAYLALHAAAGDERVTAVIAIAPTSEEIARRRFRGWDAEVDAEGFTRLLDSLDLHEAAARILARVLYVIARDDERIPLEHVRRLHELTPRSELVVLKSGGHGGPAHDPAVHELTLDWLERT